MTTTTTTAAAPAAPAATAAVLEAHEVETGYGGVQILWGISIVLAPGTLTALVGANGGGKTTLLRAIVGQLPLWRGAVTFDGADLGRLPPHGRAARGLVLVPEGRQLFATMTVAENLELGATPRRARAAARRNRERVLELFPRLGERLRQRAGSLSGGEQQMLAVARGIMADPRLLIVDELSMGLAPLLAASLFAAMRRLRDGGLSILLVEQNVQLALAVSDAAIVMESGRVARSGSAADLAGDDGVRKSYLGV
ncbi:MAG: ABC transporter ATP-binding protein [Candidatus Schekmanbacteria bacterium]|nr:ABC transporter ATP-binding protein [Candidatus Schekmanbacteria bacterium]